MENYSLSDIAAVSGENGWGGGNSWFGMIILFALIFGWGGNGFGNRSANGEPVTEAGLCNAMNFNNLENAVGRINDQMQTQFTQLNNGMCQLGYQNLESISNLQQNMNERFCGTERAIDNVNYNNAINTASINSKIDNKFAELEKNQLMQTITNQQNQLNQLFIQSQLYGVVRYPNGFAYNAGSNPFCGCNSNGCCNI
jgi:hypothetical protein